MSPDSHSSSQSETTSNSLRPAYMEDVNAATLAAMEVLYERQIIDVADPETDRLWDAISATLEKHFNYPDYASYN